MISRITVVKDMEDMVIRKFGFEDEKTVGFFRMTEQYRKAKENHVYQTICITFKEIMH